MKLRTASETISFIKALEDQSAKYYENMADKYSVDKNLLLSCAEENNKFINQIQRAYYSVISDALEGGFAFELESDDYAPETNLPEEVNHKDALNKAIRMEERILGFYTTAADQSMSLMADLPRNFKIIAKKRANRIEKLKTLL